MTTNDMLAFLSAHQPLPGDLGGLTETMVHTFVSIVDCLEERPDMNLLDLLLGSFGDGDGWGSYELVRGLLFLHPAHLVRVSICRHLSSSVRSIVYWNCQMAPDLWRNELYEPDLLAPALHNVLGKFDTEVDATALDALEYCANEETMKVLEKLRATSAGSREFLANLDAFVVKRNKGGT